jgi:hypothetical protein
MLFRRLVAVAVAPGIACVALAAGADKPLRPAEARTKVGWAVTVEMTVRATKDRLEKRGEIYLDSEPDFRSAKNFAVVITRAGAASLRKAGIADPAAHFKGMRIRATGTVKEVDSVPRIEVADARQIRPAQTPGLDRSLVVKGQGFFPVALRLHDGRIAVVLRGGAGHLGIQGRLDMAFSSDEGKTWTRPTLVVDSPADDRNPALGQARDGTLVVAYWRTANYDEKGRYNPKLQKPTSTWVTRSQDGGKTWSESTQIDVSDIGWGSPYGRILTLPDGTLLMPVYGGPVRRPGEQAADSDNSYLYRSTDHGKTWARYATPGPGKFNETALMQPVSGKLLAAMRTRAGGEVWLTASSDKGKTWGEPRKLTPARVHPADLILLPDQRVLLVTGYRVGPFGVQGLVSDREGKFDWGRRFVLVNDAVSADCGYPSSVLLKDGRVLTVYYATGSKKHPAWGVHCGAVTYRVPAGP